MLIPPLATFTSMFFSSIPGSSAVISYDLSVSATSTAGEATNFFGQFHQCSAEAIAESQVLVVKRSSVMSRAERERDLSRQLWMLTVRELQRVQQHSLVLIKSAEERVAGFLLEMAGRCSGSGAIELPMPRQDISDYLGLTIETVSRTFTQLVQSEAISLETSRRIQFRNRAALSRLDA
jgi:CRP/FNR family nitrogen fixation transcriptional regulator